MKTVVSSRKHHCITRFGTMLIAAPLIAGMVGCDFSPPGGVRHSLGISSTEGGSVTEPGAGVFPSYSEGRVVDLAATPDSGYHFEEWTGDVDTIAGVEDATTSITMYGIYTIVANFAP